MSVKSIGTRIQNLTAKEYTFLINNGHTTNRKPCPRLINEGIYITNGVRIRKLLKSMKQPYAHVSVDTLPYVLSKKGNDIFYQIDIRCSRIAGKILKPHFKKIGAKLQMGWSNGAKVPMCASYKKLDINFEVNILTGKVTNYSMSFSNECIQGIKAATIFFTSTAEYERLAAMVKNIGNLLCTRRVLIERLE